MIQNRIYKPELVKKVEIPKTDGGGRKLEIPTVVDRFGFRVNINCEMVINKVLEYMNDRFFWW